MWRVRFVMRCSLSCCKVVRLSPKRSIIVTRQKSFNNLTIHVPSEVAPKIEISSASNDERASRYWLRDHQEILGKLLYLSVMTRPDIPFVVNMLARFANNPSRHAWSAMKHLLRYVRNTVSLGLVLGRD